MGKTYKNEKEDSFEEPDIFKRKRQKKPTNEPNQVRFPGRTLSDIGAYWTKYPGDGPKRT